MTHREREEELNTAVTAAIVTAERTGAETDWAVVLRIEQELATLLRDDIERQVELAIARRGAIRAAVKAGHSERALDLAVRYDMRFQFTTIGELKPGEFFRFLRNVEGTWWVGDEPKVDGAPRCYREGSPGTHKPFLPSIVVERRYEW